MGFGQALSVAILIVALFVGFGYWIRFFIKKTNPDLKYDFKYKFLGTKYDEKIVEKLMDYLQAGLSKEDVEKFLLCSSRYDAKKIKEFIYIYKQMQKRRMKGGVKNGE